MEPKKILIIDDDAIIRKALSEVFELKGFQVFTAENGADGLEMFRKERPHLIILDLVMPVMGGVECLEKIRSEDSEVQVIILTGYGTDDQMNRVEELGVTDVIRKGIGFEDFLSSIEESIERRESGLMISRDPSDVKILVADDDAVIRTLLIEFLLGKGFLVLSAKDGEETSEVILRHRPAIVFLDLIMPKKDGKTVLKEMPRDIAQQIKWVFITGHGYKTKELREIDIPYRLLEKPFSLQTFESTVVELLQSFSVKI
jgi:DNA-binding NtrC family response regulator